MDLDLIDKLTERCLTDAGIPPSAKREPLRVWAMSGVERVHRTSGDTVILKYATGPFSQEPRILAHVANQGLPVPRLLSSAITNDTAAMVLEDLGEPVREPRMSEAGASAVAVHSTRPADDIMHMDGAALARLPERCAAQVAELAEADRWPEPESDLVQLERLAVAAEVRAEGTQIPPFGLCHGEFNPTSLHISEQGWRLLDWARPTHGPGLLDLAGWQPTTTPPDLASFDRLVGAYIAAGGPEAARASRGGLPPARWAFGWHRLYIIDWYLQQATTWIADPSQDSTYRQVIRRHLGETAECLLSI